MIANVLTLGNSDRLGVDRKIIRYKVAAVNAQIVQRHPGPSKWGAVSQSASSGVAVPGQSGRKRFRGNEMSLTLCRCEFRVKTTGAAARGECR